MSNQRSTAPTIKLTKSSAISEVSRSDSIGINGLVDPSDSVVVKKERNVHSPIGEEALRGSPPTPLQLPPTAIGSPSLGRRPSLSSASNSPPASIWSEHSAPLALPSMPAAPRGQLPLGSRMSPPVLDGSQRASPPWETRAATATPNKAFAAPQMKPSPPRSWSDAAKPPAASSQTRRSTLSNMALAPPQAPTAAATLWEQPVVAQRRGSISNQDPIARPVPPAPTSSILGFMQHHSDPALGPGAPVSPAAAPMPMHMQTLLGPSGKHDEFHKSLIPRSVPLSHNGPAGAASKVPAVLRLAVPADNDRDVSESDGGDSASITSDLSPQISPFTSPRTGDDTELAGIFGQMEMDAADYGHGGADPHAPEGAMPSGEHPLGEFPSSTLFVRNINSNVEDDELRALFEPFGPIRSMYTQCKHRGFVMISYFEIRHAQNAMLQLQGRLVRRRKLDIHYSIPKSYGSAHSSPSPSSRSPSTFHRSASMQRTPSGPWGAPSNPASLQSSSSAPLSFALHLPNAFSPPPPPQIPPPAARLPVSHSEPLVRPDIPPAAMSTLAPRPSSPESMLSTSPKAPPAAGAKGAAIAASASGGRHHRPVASEDKSKYDMDLDRIRIGEDTRLTLMIKNIPNKYNQKMLLAAVDERHKGTYDFFYLPIDFKNKCNVGYAFINFVKPISIVAFYLEFNNRKWEKFNSEKVCTISYARIQGKSALIQHFQNSSLMSEDKKCRPIIFHSEGPNQGEQEPFPVGPNIRTRRTVGSKATKGVGRKSGKEEKPSPDPAQSPSSL